MSFTIDTRPGERLSRDIREFGRQVAFATVVALTRTAQDVRQAEVREVDDSFDRPTPFTRNAFYVEPATLQRPEARVGIKDDFAGAGGGRAAVRWLAPNIEGGRRQLKGFEKAIRGLGVMDGSQFIVPGRYAKLDQYGNLSRGQLLQILSQLRTFTGAETVSRNLPRDGDYERNRGGRTPAQVRAAAYRRSGGQFFAVGPAPRGGLRPGIYQRQVAGRRLVGPASRRPRPVMLFVSRVQYERRFAFEAAARYEAERAFPRRLAEAMQRYVKAGAA